MKPVINHAKLRKVLTERCSLEDLQNAAFDLGIEYEGLEKENLARRLIENLDNRERLNELIDWIQDNRSDISTIEFVEQPLDTSSVNPTTPRDPAPGEPTRPPAKPVTIGQYRGWLLLALLLFVGGGGWLVNRWGQPLDGEPTPTIFPPTAVPTVTANMQWTPQFKTFEGVEMALVPPGCFTMGTEDPPSSDTNDEKPTTRICFDKSFWIDKTEVTQAQFKRLGGVAGRPPAFPGDNWAVDRITWVEARDFCAKRHARLPTEAEWEYAARGPDNLIFPWGNTFDSHKIVWAENSGAETAEVGSRPAGAAWIGAVDMSGNVWEWVSSLYWPYPYNAADGRENRDNDNEARSLRGGSWVKDELVLRAAYRNWKEPFWEDLNFGFRCARSS